MFLFAEARWLMQQFRRVILWYLAWRDNSRVPADCASYKRRTSQIIESLASGLPACSPLGAQQQWTFEALEVVPCGSRLGGKRLVAQIGRWTAENRRSLKVAFRCFGCAMPGSSRYILHCAVKSGGL